jgi:ABC-2 type transport system ATP-binding protein
MDAIQTAPVAETTAAAGAGKLVLEYPRVELDGRMDALRAERLSKHFTTPLGKKDRDKADKLAPPTRWQRVKRIFVPGKKRKLAVDGVSLSMERGEIAGIVGHNGCGKSTLIRMISTLLTPDGGSLTVFGHDPVRDPYRVQKLINRVSVDAAFFKKLSAVENLLYAARLYGVDDKLAVKRAEAILLKLGLEEGRLTDSLQELSRGMQQKVAIARALLTSPVLLLLDEPTTGLDPKSKRDVQDFVLELNREHDATVLLTSHDMAEVERLCSRIILMNDGKFVAEGTAAELKEQVRQRKLARGEELAIDAITMESVFIELTGHEWKSAEEDVENKD